MPYIALDQSAATVIPSTGMGDPVLDNGMTYAEMQAELEAAGAGRSDIDAERIGLYANWGYVDLATDLKLDELTGSIAFDLVVDQSLYLLPKEVWTMQFASVQNSAHTYPEHGGTPLIKTTKEDYRQLPSRSDDVPSRFFRSGNLLVVYPTPTVVYPLVIDFRVRPLFMTESTHCPILGTEWHEGIVLAARAKMFRMNLEPDLAAGAENDLISFVRKKQDRAHMEEDGRRPSTSVPQKMSGKMMYRKPGLGRPYTDERNW